MNNENGFPIPVNILETLVGKSKRVWMLFTSVLTVGGAILISVSMSVRGLPVRPYQEQGMWIIAFLLSSWLFTRPALE